MGNTAHDHILAAEKMDDLAVASQALIINDGAPVPFWDHMRDVWAIFQENFPDHPKPKRTIVIPRRLTLILAHMVVFLP